ncbi:DUF4998 domain-containing protein [Compostibacter hankyongensis]|uniref:DUF4998 domain-containing protein n=2 Tax=Compostibacter hankyongensis TaxID=1007089 RepID=A0ABP8FNR6_9BACT
MDHTYEPIIKDGEIVYTGKADSVRAFSGKDRLALSWLLSDPKITYCKLYWNGGADSLLVPVKQGSLTDSIHVMLDNMQEGTYTFTIYTGDDEGHRSVKSEVVGRVYGDQYAGTLSNRLMKDARWTDGEARLIWEHAVGSLAGAELSYTSTAGDVRQLFISPEADTIAIADLKEGSKLQYRTLFLPDSAAIDTFYTGYTQVTPVFETLMDKSAFKELILPGDALTAYGWVLSRLWDGSIKEGQGFFCTGSAFPFHYTFDLGAVVQLSRYKIWQRGNDPSSASLYNSDNPSSWEIWGATDPADDGSWTGWTKLMVCRSFKPSQAALGTNTVADKAYALAGEEYILSDTLPPVRYIRINVLETWNKGKSQANSMELTFWKKKQ